MPYGVTYGARDVDVDARIWRVRADVTPCRASLNSIVILHYNSCRVASFFEGHIGTGEEDSALWRVAGRRRRDAYARYR